MGERRQMDELSGLEYLPGTDFSRSRTKLVYGGKMKVLIACEYSGRVRDAFIARGHDATSCDLLPTESPGPHHQGDVLPLLGYRWDLVIAHPPCTYLTCAGEWAFKDDPGKKLKPGTLFGAERRQAREDALEFVTRLWEANSPRVCIENPVGVITKRLPALGTPQYIHPHQFGEDASKKTGLWMRGLPPLVPTSNYPPRIVNGKRRWGNQTDSGQNKLAPSDDRWKLRSYTYQGIADAMAGQWG